VTRLSPVPRWAGTRTGRLASVLAAFSLAGVLYASDVASKNWAESELRRRGPRSLLGGMLVLHYRTNSGIAFGLLQAELYFKKRERLIAYSAAVSGAVALVLLLRLGLGRLGPWPTSLGLVALLGGSAGNLRDRVNRGGVIDFIDVELGIPWPAFNLADIYLFVGICLCAVGLWRAYRKDRAAPAQKA